MSRQYSIALAVISAVLAIIYNHAIALVYLEMFGYVSVSLTRHAPINLVLSNLVAMLLYPSVCAVSKMH